MEILKTIFVIIDLLICVSLICIIVFQSGKTSGLSGALTGGSDTFLSKNKSRTLDAKLARSTKWVAIVFVLVTIVLNLI